MTDQDLREKANEEMERIRRQAEAKAAQARTWWGTLTRHKRKIIVVIAVVVIVFVVLAVFNS